MNKTTFEYIEPRRTFWARHLIHRMVRGLKKRGMNVTKYRLCAFPNDLIGREIAVAGAYEAAGTKAVKWLCEHHIIENPQERAFLDIGANVGVYAVALAPYFAGVLAFEPHPVARQILALNVSINALSNISLFDYGLSDSDMTADLFEGTADNLGASSVERGVGEGKKYCVTLRHATRAIRQATNMRICFIKIDVEGHEPKVLTGLSSLLADQQPVVAFEANDPAHNQDLSEQLAKLGYTKFLALDWSPTIRHLWLRVLVLTLTGIRSTLKPVANLAGKKYSLVFALPAAAAKRWHELVEPKNLR